MFDYETLARHPGAFRSLTGMSPAEFADLLTAFRAALERRRRDCRATRAGRAAGPGPPPRHDDRHRLLMALVCRRDGPGRHPAVYEHGPEPLRCRRVLLLRYPDPRTRRRRNADPP